MRFNAEREVINALYIAFFLLQIDKFSLFFRWNFFYCIILSWL